MGRDTRFLVDELSSQTSEAIELIQIGEKSRDFLYNRRLHIYEAAYLIVFSAWENFLEQSFLRFLCGYSSSGRRHSPVSGRRFSGNIAAAHETVLSGRKYILWHNPNFVIERSKKYFVSGPHEYVLSSALSDIENFASIRHFVAHRNIDTSLKFQKAATDLTGAPIVGGRPGRLLRRKTIDVVTGSDVTWFEKISNDLLRYANQIAN